MTLKTPLITINVFAHARRRYIKTNFQQLAGLEKSLKSEICINLIADNCTKRGLSGIAKELQKSGISTRLIYANTYLKKVDVASKVKTAMVSKIDEDIFLTTENWHKLLTDSFNFKMEDEGILAPLISSGVPSVEYFLDNFLGESEVNSLREKFSKFVFVDAWGVDFSSLQGSYSSIEYSSFFNTVSKLNHYYKGVHPIRFSSDCQEELLNSIKYSKSWLLPIHSKGFILDNISPYFCNSFFITKTKTYKAIFDGINNGEYFNDGFEEVGLNQFLDRRSRPLYFNHGVAAIHPSYWTANGSYAALSDSFYQFCNSEFGNRDRERFNL